MSLHALLARAEENEREAEADVAECSKALDMLKVSTDERKSDARFHRRVRIRLRGLIDALNDGSTTQRAAYVLPEAREDMPEPAPAAIVEPEPVEEPEIAPPPAPEPLVEEPKVPAALPTVPTAKTFNERVLAEIVRVQQPNGYASVEIPAIARTLRVPPSKVRTAIAALKAAKMIGGVTTKAGAEPGWATYKVFGVVEQAA